MSAFPADIRSIMSLGLPYALPANDHNIYSYYYMPPTDDEEFTKKTSFSFHILFCKETTVSRQKLVDTLKKIESRGNPVI
jgi:hypothetical protein